jgi:hypothetical protein
MKLLNATGEYLKSFKKPCKVSKNLHRPTGWGGGRGVGELQGIGVGGWGGVGRGGGGVGEC